MHSSSKTLIMQPHNQCARILEICKSFSWFFWSNINSAGFVHGGAAKNFGFEYVLGSNLLQTLSKPNGMTLTQTYEAQRDLLIGMAYRRGSSLVVQREYSYDTLGRPTARNTARQGILVEYTLAMAYLALEILVHGVNLQSRGKVHLKILNG